MARRPVALPLVALKGVRQYSRRAIHLIAVHNRDEQYHIHKYETEAAMGGIKVTEDLVSMSYR